MNNTEIFDYAKYKSIGIADPDCHSHKERPSWDEYFLKIAFEISRRSLDYNTCHGTALVKNNRIISTGYNSFPAGCPDHLMPNNRHKDLKYIWVTHSETAAIYNAAKNGICIEGAKLYCTGLPCANCTMALVNVGIFDWIIGGKTHIFSHEENLRRQFFIEYFNIQIKEYPQFK